MRDILNCEVNFNKLVNVFHTQNAAKAKFFISRCYL